MKLKVFEVYRHFDDSESKLKDGDIGTRYSIQEVLRMEEQYLTSRIFKIVYEATSYDLTNSRECSNKIEDLKSGEEFHFVHLKVRNAKNMSDSGNCSSGQNDNKKRKIL